MTPALRDSATLIVRQFGAAGYMIATAESCTGGLIAATLTTARGASAVVDRGFVTYTNEAKYAMLGVPMDITDGPPGAVSEAVVRLMAEGALARSVARVAVAVSGIAGPDGGSDGKPVGLVHLACAWCDGDTDHQRAVFAGNRDAVREQTVERAFRMLLDGLGRRQPRPDA